MAEFRTERKGDIIKCEYTVSGGIEGGAYSLRASKTGDKTKQAELATALSELDETQVVEMTDRKSVV